MQRPSIPSAILNWDEQGHPVSTSHDDVYYSRENGIEESEYVFLHNNDISNRLIETGEANQLTVAEVGFGTGLNFLCTWLAWRKLGGNSARKRLHFVSVEKWPIRLEDLQRISAHWPELSELSGELVSQYPPHIEGCHRLVFEGGDVTLTLYFGDVVEQYTHALFMADAWYLDGFAPHKSREMWSPELFDVIGNHSATHATFSTFSIAGVIRRGMTQAGFSVKKVQGFGRKKEMHVGVYAQTTQPNKLITTPWLRTTPRYVTKQTTGYDAVVIGAGLAGATTAYALSQKGHTVLIIDKGSEPATGGSGNPQGALYNKFSTEFDIQTKYALTNLLFSQRYYDNVQKQSKETFWSKCGLIQAAWCDKEAKKQADLLTRNHYPKSLFTPLTAEEASDISGIHLQQGGFYFPSSGWVAPKIACKTLLKHKNITQRFNQFINELSFDETTQRWQCFDNNGEIIASAPNIIVCSASDATKLKQLTHLKTKAIRGQVSIAKTRQALPIKTVICGEGYISPASQSHYCFGATFDLKSKQCDIFDADHQTNISQLSAWLTAVTDAFKGENLVSMDGRASLRCTSPDYLPMVGPAPVFEGQVDKFSRLRFDAKHAFEGEGVYYPGLFVNIAHGSKGLSSCPLSAEYISSLIFNEPSPLTEDLIKAVSPSRFIIRNLIRRKI